MAAKGTKSSRWPAWAEDAQRNLLKQVIEAGDGSWQRIGDYLDMPRDGAHRLGVRFGLIEYATKIRAEFEAAFEAAFEAEVEEGDPPSNVVSIVTTAAEDAVYEEADEDEDDDSDDDGTADDEHDNESA
jgi:hypothetical protein